MAGAAAAVIVASGVAVAAITGYLPGSKAEKAPEKPHATASKQHLASAKPAADSAKVKPCAECGVIVEVKEVDVLGKGTGVGAVAGGVAGAVVGHEIGDGSRAGTAVGAVVGGVAGHQIERSARRYKRYDVSIRMNDGSVKNVSSDTPPGWRSGDHVRVLQDGKVQPI